MSLQFSHLRLQRFLFLLCVTAIYASLIVGLDFLQGPGWWDEITFWDTSLRFSDRLLPTVSNLKDYNELSTPLPFIIFGALEHLFGRGIFAGRLLNILLSLSMVFMIGWPKKRAKGSSHRATPHRAILCAVGLLLCPYYLWLSGRLYTEMLACFWVIVGFYSHINRQYFLSFIAFVLAISSRQYMVAFPAAIALYEIITTAAKAIHCRQIQLAVQKKWLMPLLATLSIFGWFYLFQGLTPQTALEVRLAPDIQKTAWAVRPGGAVNFLAFVGLYIVIPEFLLFEIKAKLTAGWRHQKIGLSQEKRRKHGLMKYGLIAIALLLYVAIFPPISASAGNTGKVARLLQVDELEMLWFYGLSLLACLRFSRPNLLSIVVFANSLIMVKAFPWDRYVLPLVVVFWYAKANGIEEKFSLWASRT